MTMDAASTPSHETHRIRRATAADVGLLTSLRAALFDEGGRGPADERARAFAQACEPMLTDLLGSGRAFAWLAEDATGRALSTLTLLVYPRLPTPRDLRTAEGYVLGVYTVPGWRRRGLAEELVRVAIEEARTLGLARLRLHATENGWPLYLRLGFEGRPTAVEMKLG